MRQGEYPLPFPDRRAAGTMLGERLARVVALGDWAERAMVLALPRGGVAVAKQVATVLDVPMNVIVTRKIGYPRQPELGVGAIAEGLETAVYDASLTARAALRSLRAAQAAYVVLAAPVAAPAAAGDMRAEADQVIILATPRRFRSVGEWYRSFGQLTDADVLALLG